MVYSNTFRYIDKNTVVQEIKKGSSFHAVNSYKYNWYYFQMEGMKFGASANEAV